MMSFKRIIMPASRSYWGSRCVVLLKPGLGLKRWLALFAIGLLLFGLGVGFTMSLSISPKILPLLRLVTFGELSPLARGVVFMVGGTVASAIAMLHVVGWIISGTSKRVVGMDLLTSVNTHQYREKGLRVVAMGGGTGVATLLRGLKKESANITAIVTIADDGGSSGRLRQEIGMQPPGDARNCLVALSEAEPIMDEIFDYRFNTNSPLNGHSLGNLLIAALSEKGGGLQEGLEAAAELLALSGRVVPISNNNNLVLMGETVSGQVLTGESAVGSAKDPLRRVWIEPSDVVPSTAALEAISQAEMIVIGPGSLFTSIIPNFLIPGVAEAVSAVQVPKIFVCNVATQRGETDYYSVDDHLSAFQTHSKVSVSHVIVNSNVRILPVEHGQVAVSPVSRIDGFGGQVILADVLDDSFPTRHDPQRLTKTLMSLMNRAASSN